MNLFASNSRKPATTPTSQPSPSNAQSAQPPSATQTVVAGARSQADAPTDAARNTTSAVNSGLQLHQQVLLEKDKNRKPRPIKFKQLYRQLEKDPEEMFQLLENPEFKKIFSAGLQYFDKSPEKKQKYEKMYEKAPNFGMLAKEQEEQEFKNFRSEKIDNFWKFLVETASEMFSVSEYLICQYLQAEIRQRAVYAKILSVKEFAHGAYVRAPNNPFIEALFTKNYELNQVVVSMEGELFVSLLRMLFLELYSEQVLMVRIMEYLQEHNPRYFREVIKKSDCSYFSAMWNKLKQFSQKTIKQELEGNEPRNKKIKQFYKLNKKHDIEKKIREEKMKVRMKIGTALLGALDQYGSWKKEPIINSLINYSQAFKFLDADLQVLIAHSEQSPINQYKYIKNTLQLLLKIVPISAFNETRELRPSFLQARDIDALRQLIKSSTSPAMQPFKFLVWFTGGHRNAREVEEHWEKIIKNVEWMMRSEVWGEWLGVLLGACRDAEQLYECESLLNQVVKMCKIVVSDNADEFWAGEKYEYELIKTFMKGSFQDRGIKAFLPVLTKCLQGSLSNVASTVDLIGFNNFRRQIRDTLVQDLQFSQQGGSMGMSIFRSYNPTDSTKQRAGDSSDSSFVHRVTDNYPEQQLKFLCRMVVESKRNLFLVEQCLFECHQGEETGIPTCKFLLECLATLKQYKIPALKCMRYVIVALDNFFVEISTRPALMVAFCIHFMERDGDKNRAQLFDMVNFACSRQSASEEYRQSQKLRTALAYHLCNIVRLSTYLGEYFPLREDFRFETEYMQAHNYYASRNFSFLHEWYYKHYGVLRYKSTPWLATLLLLLQSNRLLPISLQTVRLLILKMNCDKIYEEEYECLSFVVEVLNKASIIKFVLDSLEPMLKPGRNPKTGESLFLFGLENARLYEVIELHKNKAINAQIFQQDQSYLTIREKQIKALKNDKVNAIGNISGSLQLLASLLQIRNNIQGQQTNLIHGLNLFQQLETHLSINSLYHYKLTMAQSPSRPDLQTPSLRINLLQVIASLLNFEPRYQVPTSQPSQLHSNKQHNLRCIEIYNYMLAEQNHGSIHERVSQLTANNVLDIGENELTMANDYTIGVGGVLRVMGQVLLGPGGPGLLHRGVASRDWEGLETSADEYRLWVRELLRVLELQAEGSQKVEMVMEFLILNLSQSSYFLHEVTKSESLNRLSRSIRNIIRECSTSAEMGSLNKIALFALALSQHRLKYPDLIDNFIKYPSNLIQDILLKVTTEFQSHYRVLNKKCLQSLLENVESNKKIGFTILYKGTIHICLELIKRFYLFESLEQNVRFVTALYKSIHDFLWIPAYRQFQNTNVLQLSPRNKITATNEESICLLTENTHTNRLKMKSLTAFVGFLVAPGQQYGLNYQYNTYQVYYKCVFKYSKMEEEANLLVYETYKHNCEASLQACHQRMLSSYLSLLCMWLTTGPYGHLLSLPEDSLLLKFEPRQQWSRAANLKSSLLQAKNIYKYRPGQPISGPQLWCHSPDQTHSLKHSTIRTLVQYLEKDQLWQHNNDAILYTIALLLNDLCGGEQQTASAAGKLRVLVGFVVDSVQIRMRVSPKVLCLFYAAVLGCYASSQAMVAICQEEIERVCLILQSLVLYGTNLEISQAGQPPYTLIDDRSLQVNMFIICNALSRLLSGVPCTSVSLGVEVANNYHPARRHTIELIINICSCLVNRFLTNSEQLDLNNMALMTLVNSLLAQLAEDSQDFLHKESHALFVAIVNKYTKYLMRSLKNFDDCLFNCCLLQSLTMVAQFGSIFDPECDSLVVEYLGAHVDTREMNGSAIKTEPENYRKNQIVDTVRKTRLQKQEVNSGFFYISELLCSSSYKSKANFSLSNLVELKQVLLLLTSACSKQSYWHNIKSSPVVQSVFMGLINQNFIYKLVQSTKQGGTRVLRCKISAQDDCEQHLQQIEVEELDYNERTEGYYMGQQAARSSVQTKKINLFQFCVFVQVCHVMRYYTEALGQCLEKSQNLRSFYSKVINSHINSMDEFIWQKVTNTLIIIIEFLNSTVIQLLRYYPKSIHRLLSMYWFSKNNTDFGYDSNFLSLCLGDAGLLGRSQSTPVQQFREFVSDLVMSVCRTAILYIQIWQSNDWKSSVSWAQPRNKLATELGELLRRCQKHTNTDSFRSLNKGELAELQKRLNRP